MFFWYFLVVVVSVFDNIVAAPFTHSWTIRVAKAPSKVMVDNTQSRITDFERDRYTTIIKCLKAGINQKHRITIPDNEPDVSWRSCFYVVISVQGILGFHPFLQILSRAFSVGIFAFGTVLFASATLMSIGDALILLCLVLPIGVVSRVVAMWVTAEMDKHNKSIIHTVVKDEVEAGEHMEAIINIDGLQVETMGHVILNGYCIDQRSAIFSAATYIGLLAKPYDVVTVAIKNGNPIKERNRVSSQSEVFSFKYRSQSGLTGHAQASNIGSTLSSRVETSEAQPEPSRPRTA